MGLPKPMLLIDTVELIKTIKLLGLRHMIRLKQARDFGEKIERGFFATRVINALSNIGLFDEFSTNNVVDIDSFAEKKNLDKRVLRLLCDYLYALKIFRKEESRYSLENQSKVIMPTLRGAFDLIYAYEDLFHNLEPLLKKEKIYGKDIVRRDEFVAKGTGESAKLLPFPIVIDIINKYNLKRILDLGCGAATFLISLCESNEEIKGYGIDISKEIVLQARKRLKENNLEDRIYLFEGDIFRLEEMIDKLSNIDAVTSFFVLHEFLFEGVEKVIEFLSKCRQIFKNKPLIVCEIIKQSSEELRRRPSPHLEYQLFHNLSQQGQATRKEWKEIFRESGFNLIKERYLKFANIDIFILK